jgi:hypothetical protein
VIARDDEKILEVLAIAESELRKHLIDLINAGARSTVLYSFVGAIGSVENSANNQGEDFEEEE